MGTTYVFVEKYEKLHFSYFSKKTYVVPSHSNHLMVCHKICFYEDMANYP